MSRDITSLWTFQDAVDHVLDAFDAVREGRDLRRARDAVLHANRTICELHDWQWMQQRTQFRTEEVYETGTVAYDHATLTVTLSGGTWPDNAGYYSLVFTDDNTIYPIDRRVSDTTVTLFANNNPGDDLAAGTTYQAYRDEYECPTDLRRNMDLYDLNLSTSPIQMQYVKEQDIRNSEFGLWSRFFSVVIDGDVTLPINNTPSWWTVRRSDKYDSGYSITFSHIPASARLYELSYWKSPRRLKYDKESVTASCTADDKTVTSSTAFVSGHVGAIIRFSSSTTAPTPIFGDIDRTSNTVNPYVFQAYIDSFTTTSSIELLTDAPQTLSSKAAIISDPIDIDQRYMLDLFLAIAKRHYAVHTHREDRGSWQELERAEMVRAKEADQDYRSSRGLQLYGGSY